MSQYSTFAAVCFTLNYVIGSGFLTLPWAFYESGILLACFVLTLTSVFSFLSSFTLLEVISRANALVDKFGVSGLSNNFKRSTFENALEEVEDSGTNKDTIRADIRYGALGQNSEEYTTSDKNNELSSESKLLKLGERKFEIAELVGIFLGSSIKDLYMVCIALYFYGAMWAYSTVFSNAWAATFPLSGLSDNENYYLYLSLWGIIESVWCLLELDEQVVVQVVLAFGRILMVLVMVITVYYAEVTNVDSFSLTTDPSTVSTIGGSTTYFQPENLYIVIPICFYANVMHHSVPTLVKPMKNKDSAGTVFSIAFIVSFCSYIVLATVVSGYFGDFGLSSSNLNWQNYLGFNPTTSSRPLYANAISHYIVLFPSLDVASTFPLNAVTLGNNFMSIYYGTEAMPEMERSWKKRSVWRLLAAVPPIIAAGLVKSLGPITAYTGLTGIFLAVTFPYALGRASEKYLQERGMETKSIFHFSFMSHLYLPMIVISIAVVIFVATSLVTNGTPDALK